MLWKMTTRLLTEQILSKNISMTKMQLGFFQEKAREAAYTGGIGSGKSHILIFMAINLASQGRQVLYLLPTYNMIGDVALPKLRELLETIGIKHELTLGPPTCKIGEGTIMFRSAEAGDRLRGINCHDLLIDEAGYISESQYNVAIGRVRLSEDGMIRIVSTPKGKESWLYKVVVGNNWKQFRQSTLTNPFLPRAYRESLLQSYSGDFLRQEVYGEWVDGDGHAIFIKEGLVSKALQRIPIIDNEEPIVAGLDPARMGDDRSVLAIRQGKRLLKIYIWEKIDTVLLQKEVVECVMEHKVTRLSVDAVGIGAGVYDGLTYSLHNLVDVVEFNGGFSSPDRGFRNLRSWSWGQLKDWLVDGSLSPAIKNTNRITLGDDLIKDIASLEYHIDAKSNIVLESKVDFKKRGGKSPDLADAIAMTFHKPSDSIDETEKERVNNVLRNMYGQRYTNLG